MRLLTPLDYPFMAQAYPMTGVMTCRMEQICAATDHQMAEQIATSLNVTFASPKANLLTMEVGLCDGPYSGGSWRSGE